MAALCSLPSNHRRRVAIIERLAVNAVQLEPIGSTTEDELLQPVRLALRKRLPEQPISRHLAHIRALGVTHFALAQVEALPVIARCCSSASQSHAGTLADWSCRTPQTKAPSLQRIIPGACPKFGHLTLHRITVALPAITASCSTTASPQQLHGQFICQLRTNNSISGSIVSIAATSSSAASHAAAVGSSQHHL